MIKKSKKQVYFVILVENVSYDVKDLLQQIDLRVILATIAMFDHQAEK